MTDTFDDGGYMDSSVTSCLTRTGFTSFAHCSDSMGMSRVHGRTVPSDNRFGSLHDQESNRCEIHDVFTASVTPLEGETKCTCHLLWNFLVQRTCASYA